MKIIALTVNNFRQFFGEHQINFSTDDRRNVTIIHGENGAGKTTLLNAFKWAFYGGTDFDSGVENILNEQAIGTAKQAERIPVAVRVDFEHESARYTAERTQGFTKVGGMSVEPIGGSLLELTWIDADGRYQKSSNPENQINQILPEKMHSYFFFNGERIEKLANARAAGQIRDAIKTLMGLEVVERGVGHLREKVVKIFRKRWKDESSEQLAAVLEEEASVLEHIETVKRKLETVRENIAEYKEEMKAVGTRLVAIGASAKLQNEREEIEGRLLGIRGERDEATRHARELISERGFLAFIDGVVTTVDEILEDRRHKGELPYKIKEQFIDDLLAEGRCICGRDLAPSTPARESVEAFRRNAGSEGLEEAFLRTSSDLKQIPKARVALFDALRANAERTRKLREERERLTGRLDTISSELSKLGHEDAAALEERRQKLERDRDEALRQEGRLRDQLAELEEKAREVRATRMELATKSELAEATRRKLEVAEECLRVLQALHAALSDQTRSELSKRVNGTFQKILRKGYWAEIDTDYALQIYKEVGEHGRQMVYEKSTGESQVTSLSFIASIVSLAKEKHQQGSSFFRGGVYPIVMDSPFGALDPDYREKIARYIPELADQVIVLASNSQWRGEVERECGPRVGKEVSLIYYSPHRKDGVDPYYVREGSDYERTEIEDGYHGR